MKKYKWLEVKPGVHKIIKDNGEYLTLLAEGRLVNLALATGHPSRIMDGSFCNQVLAQIELFKQSFASKHENDKEVYIVEECVGSRKLEDADMGINRMLKSGASLINFEMIFFELIRDSKNQFFKKLSSKFVK